MANDKPLNELVQELISEIQDKKAEDRISKIYEQVNKQGKILAQHTILLRDLTSINRKVNLLERQQLTWKGVIVGATGIGVIMAGAINLGIKYFKN